ncbi:hypothetical protein NDR87_36970 [Nocardia sp. CDC159]|uniref:Uncharacterized protein n=1 Tax=Nocardia pulmonis TaxID=2951408 RepID=A0A9X2J2D9_9NOCA|nr:MULTISPECIES: hypothetical protein [Nocardia]MCM6779080.1 hypothetical protein [Nocardia pulmonis]MCM6791970.1 hypothetical protein [Nocardia sp. CDC159]
MYAIASIAGFCAAHGIWSISDGATLIPILGYEQHDGARGMERFVFDDIADSARAGQTALATGRDQWARAVLVTDAYLHLDTGRVDALIVDAVEYFSSRRSLQLAIPYRPQQDPEGFGVYQPQLLDTTGFDEFDYDVLAESFNSGVGSHEHAAAIWSEFRLDESL